MKKPFSRKRSWAGWALMTGTLGLAAPTSAQLSPAVAAVPPAVATTEPAASGTTDSRACLEAIVVELAWLADPATFPYNLGIYPTGPTTFEVRGYVPDETTRAQALQLARAHTTRIVTDSVKVFAGMAAPPGPDQPEVVRQAVSQQLAATLRERARGVSVQATPGGRVTLTGLVSCHEERLAMSRRLRGVRGCTAVVNDLTVVTVLRDGKLYHLVTADGRHKVAAHPEVLHVNYSTPSQPAPGGTAEPVVSGSDARPPALAATMQVHADPATVKTPAPLALTSMKQANEIPAAPAAMPAGPTPGPRIVMVKVWQTEPGSMAPVQREVPVMLSGTAKGQPTRPLFEEEVARLQAHLARQAPPLASPVVPAVGPVVQSAPVVGPTVPPAPLPPASRPTVAPNSRPGETIPTVRPQPAVAEPKPLPTPIVPVSTAPRTESSVRPAVHQPTAAPVAVPVPPAPARTPPPASPRTEPTPASSYAPAHSGPRPAVTPPGVAPRKPEPAPSVSRNAPPPVVRTEAKPGPSAASPSERNLPSAPPAVPVRTAVKPPLPPAPLPTRTPLPPPEKKGETVALLPQVTRGVVTITEPEERPSTGRPKSAPVSPYVSTGVVTFDDEPAAPVPASQVPHSPAELRKRIEAVCGGEARNVEVIAGRGRSLRVYFKVAKTEDAQRLSEKVVRMPELGSFEVSVEVESLAP